MRNCRSAVQKWLEVMASRPSAIPALHRQAPTPSASAWCCRLRTAPQRAGPAPGPHSPKPCTGPAGLRPAGGSRPFRWRGLFSGRAVPSVIAAAFQRPPSWPARGGCHCAAHRTLPPAAFALLFAADAGVCGDDRRFWEDQGVTPRVAMKKSPFQGCFSLGFVL